MILKTLSKTNLSIRGTSKVEKNLKSKNRNIIKIFDEEISFFERFTKKYNILWSNEERRENLISISNSYVGYIVTPIRKINLSPKYDEIGFEHIFRMYLYIYSYQKTDDNSILDITNSNKEIDIANTFLKSVEKNIQQGIYQSYSKRLKDVSAIKGRIRYAKTYQNYLLNKHNYVSSYISGLEINNDINNLIVSALVKLRKIKKYTSRVSSLLMYYQGVSGDIENGSKALAEINFNSNTNRFKQTLTYASMIIDRLDFDNVGNTLGTESFLINFDKLFEDFVAKILTTIPKKKEFLVWSSTRDYGTIHRSNGLIEKREYLPDIVYRYVEEDENMNYFPTAFAVLDVKNKAFSTFKNADVYQILTYARLLSSSKMLLLYPSFDTKVTESMILNPELFSPSIISACFVNIRIENGTKFLEEITRFANEVYSTINFW